MKQFMHINRCFIGRVDTFVVLSANITGVIDEEEFLLALGKVRRRYPILGTRVLLDDSNDAFLVSEDAAPFKIEFIEKENIDFIQTIVDNHQVYFPVFQGPLIRFILQKAERKYNLTIIGFHGIVDGTSMMYIFHDLMRYLEDPNKPIEVSESPPLHECLPLPIKLSIGQKIANMLGHKMWKKHEVIFKEEDYERIYANISELYTKDLEIIVWELTEEQTDSIIVKAKNEGVTVNSVICTAFYLAENEVFENLGVKPKNELLVAVDVRDYLSNVPHNAVGLYNSAVDLTLGDYKNHDFWVACKKIHKKIHNKLNQNSILNLLGVAYYAPATVVDAIFVNKYNKLNHKWLNFFAKTVKYDKNHWRTLFTNLGKFDFPKEYGRFKVHSVYFQHRAEGADKTLAFITCNDKLSFTFSFDSSVIKESIIQKIKENAMKYLVQ